MPNRNGSNCPICESAGHFSYSHDSYDLYNCPVCSHCFVAPAPNEETLAAIYNKDESALANSDGWTLAQDYKVDPKSVRHYYQKSRINDLVKEIPDFENKNTTILDVGCSTGLFLRCLKDKGYTDLYGLDVSPGAASYVQENHDIPCETNLDTLPNSHFDVVTCYAVLEHVPDPLAFARSLSQKLKPGGRLVFLVPNYDSFYRRAFKKNWVWLVPPVHLQYFSPASLRHAMKTLGLSPQTLKNVTSGTYIYLAVYHLMKFLKKPMPSTSRSRNKKTMALVNFAEDVLRICFWPLRKFCQMTNKGNELLVIAIKPA